MTRQHRMRPRHINKGNTVSYCQVRGWRKTATREPSHHTWEPGISLWKASVVSFTRAVKAWYSGEPSPTTCSMSMLIPSMNWDLAKFNFSFIHIVLFSWSTMYERRTSPLRWQWKKWGRETCLKMYISYLQRFGKLRNKQWKRQQYTFKNNSCAFGMSVTHQFSIIFPKHG